MSPGSVSVFGDECPRVGDDEFLPVCQLVSQLISHSPCECLRRLSVDLQGAQHSTGLFRGLKIDGV